MGIEVVKGHKIEEAGPTAVLDGKAGVERIIGGRLIGHGFIDRSTPGLVNLGVLNRTGSATATLDGDVPLPDIITQLNKLAKQAGIERLVSTGVMLPEQTDPDV